MAATPQKFQHQRRLSIPDHPKSRLNSRRALILKAIELLAPVSAGTALETGYVLNQSGKPDEGLSAYRRAHSLALQYASQRPYRAAALRGMGFALIELKKLAEAERAYLEALEIEPGNKVALNELAFIHNQQGSK
jgi:tetratricopeptide (TPR) repeat protein